MTEIGQIKKEKAIFNTIRMSRRWDGQEATLRLNGRDYALTSMFYDELSCLNKQVKTLLYSQGNH
jgi:hypothetical protein